MNWREGAAERGRCELRVVVGVSVFVGKGEELENLKRA
jgi:hypothetical protein